MKPQITTRKVCPVVGIAQEDDDAVGDASKRHPPPGSVRDPLPDPATDSGKNGTTLSTPALKLSKWSHRCIWCFILLHQLLNGFLLACLTAMYGTVDQRDTVLWFMRYTFLFSQAQGFLDSVHVYASVGYCVVSIMFSYGALSMIWCSVCRKRFCYDTDRSATSPMKDDENQSNASAKAAGAVGRNVITPVINCLKQCVNVYKSFGLRGRHFTTGFFVREVVESILQTTQAYKSSASLSNTFVNQSYGVLIFLNCLTCVVLTHVFRSDMTNGRLVCVLLDLTLDFAWGTVIPLVVFWPYLQLYYQNQRDPSVVVLPGNVQHEVEHILVLSTSDFILSVFPFTSSVMNIRGVKRLLSDAMRKAEKQCQAIPVQQTNAHTKRDCASAHSAAPKKTESVRRPRSVTRKIFSSPWWTNFFHGVMLVYGVAVLGISISSRKDFPGGSPHPCLHRVYPWLSENEACVGRVINCEPVRMNGTLEEITEALLLFDEKTLSTLEFSGCMGLEIPPEIHRFQQLTELTIRDSELLHWSSDAGVAGGAFLVLQTIHLSNVSIAGVPDGLVSGPLPESVEWIAISEVDMESLFDEIGDNWRHLKYLYCDSCNLDKMPTIVAGMTGILELSFCYNSIAFLDDPQFERLANLENFWIDGSPLLAFPDTLWRMSSSLSEFSFQNTNISDVPEWVNDIAGSALQMYGFGTPLCMNKTLADQYGYMSCEEVVY